MGLLDSIFGHFSGQQAADDANEFTAAMRRTAYQTAVKDMKAAGLNPILAYGKGGAPMGSSAVAPTDGLGIDETVNTALAVRKQKEEVENIKAQTASTNAQAQKTQAEAEIARINAHSAKKLGFDPNAGTPGLIVRGGQSAAEKLRNALPTKDEAAKAFEKLFDHLTGNQ